MKGIRESMWRIFIGCCIGVIVFGVALLVFLQKHGSFIYFPNTSERPMVIPMDSSEFNALPQFIQEASKAVVLVRVDEVDAKAREKRFYTPDFQSPGQKSGSGIIIHPRLVLTAFHVVWPSFGSSVAYLPVITTVKYGDTVYQAVPIAFDANFDMALLEVDTELPIYANIAQASLDKWESKWFARSPIFYIVGFFPDKSEKGFSKYIYQYDSRKNKVSTVFGPTYFALPINASNFHGFSGGPILNQEGEIVGISTQTSWNFIGRQWNARKELVGPSAPIIQEFLKSL